MFKVRYVSGLMLLFVSLAWLLAACGNTTDYPTTSDNSLVTIQTLEDALNLGNGIQALDLFSDDGVIHEVKPAANSIDYTAGFDVLGPYYIPRAYSAAAEKTTYKGQREISFYLSNLMKSNFKSKDSFYQADEEGNVTWVFESNGPMQFKATVENWKIKTLTVTMFQNQR